MAAVRTSIVLAFAAAAALATSDVRIAADQPAPIPPVNDVSNPYTTIKDFFKLPNGRQWGSTSAVDVDKDGKSIWVAERCGGNSCLDSATNEIKNIPTILKFDTNGNLVKAFGEGLLIFPHGIHVDREGNIWVTDGQDNAPRPARGAGAGAAGAAGAGAARGPATPGPGAGATKGHQVFKFDNKGKLIKTWGKWGSGNGEFDQPHALAFDSKGLLYIGDRNNNRVQVFDQDGNYKDVLYDFSRPSGIYIDKNDNLYVADSESKSVSRNHQDWKRGIRIGSLKDKKVTAFIPDPDENATGTSAAEGVVVDSSGNVYGAEVGPRAVKKYVKK